MSVLPLKDKIKHSIQIIRRSGGVAKLCTLVGHHSALKITSQQQAATNFPDSDQCLDMNPWLAR